MRERRYPLPRVIARSAALLLLPGILSSCRKSHPPSAEEPVGRLEGFVLSQSVRGRRLWELEARTAHLREASREALLFEPRMEFYKDGRAASRLSARTGRINTDTQETRLSSSVVVRSLEDGSVLETEALLYSPEKRKFLTEEPVLVKRPGQTLRGRGLEAASDLSEIRIFNQQAVLENK